MRVLTMRARLADESGIALVLALGITLVLVIMLTAVITFTAAGARDSHRVNAGQKATALAEAGLNNAFAVLNQYYPCEGCHPGDPNLLSARTTTYSSGSVTWSGTRAIAPPEADWDDEWRVTATGSVPNPTGPGAAPVTRTLRAVVPITMPVETEVGDDSPLNYIYAEDTLRFTQSVVVASPVYATDDLYLENTSTISEFVGNVPGTKNRVAVGGVFYAAQNANRIGHVLGTAPGNQLSQVYIVGGCNTKNSNGNADTHSCGFNGTDGAGGHDQIWTDTSGGPPPIPPSFLEFIPGLTCCAPYDDNPQLTPTAAPPADSHMGRAYKTADLGPRAPCTTGSVPFTFDGPSGLDNLINNSATPAGSDPIDLTPDANGPASADHLDSYSCKSERGEITWNNVTKQFRVDGTVFIDGSAMIGSSRANGATFTGKGALFLTGTFLMKSALMCVKVAGSGPNKTCDTDFLDWDPNDAVLIIVADGDGGYDTTQNQDNNIISGEGITLKGSFFQGALVANKDVTVDTTSEMQGPMISVYNDVVAGQSNVLTFPPIFFLPSGGESAIGPPPRAQLLPPRQFAGG